jgi:predicted permease
MKDKFLKAKHWQLFLLTFGIPMIFQFVMMGTMFSNIGSGNNPDPTFMFSYKKLFPIMMIIFMGVFFGWFWSVAVGLQSKVPENVKMKVKKFKIFFFIPMVYMLFMTVSMGVTMSGIMENGTEPSVGLIGSLVAIIIPLHLFSMFCIFYSLYFVAKTFKTVELQREVSFSDFAGEFFLIWFYPIGIWIVQPKINKMIEQ